MGLLCRDDQPNALWTSEIGQVLQCACCESFYVTIGNITMRMERKHLLSLTQTIIDVLEVKTASENYLPESTIRN